MSKYEKKLANDRLLKMDPAERLFRCNAGQAWTGRLLEAKGKITKLLNASRIKLLPNGTPDYCGWKSIEITPDMVGKKVAVFLAEEHKATKTDRMREDRVKAKKVISSMGGIHRVVWHDGSVEETCEWGS